MQLLIAAISLISFVGGDAAECSDATSAPYLPTFHVLSNVTRAGPNAEAAPLNDANAVFVYKGVFHTFNQCVNATAPKRPCTLMPGFNLAPVSWCHHVSDDGAHWRTVAPAIEPLPWEAQGPCDGTLSFPGGQPVVLFSWDCACPRTGHDFARLATAHAVNPEDPYLIEWVRGGNVTFFGGAAAFPGHIWLAADGSHYSFVGSLSGVGPWARWVAPLSASPAFLNWTLADADFVRPAGLVHYAMTGPLFGPIPGATGTGTGTGPTHMINANTGTAFYLGTFDEALECFTATSPDAQWIDVGAGGTPYGPSSHWAAASNGNADGDARSLWVAWASLSQASSLSLIRSLSYDTSSARLVSYPISEYEALRNRTFLTDADLGVLMPGTLHTLPQLPPEAGGAFDMLTTFALTSPDAVEGFGLAARAPPSGPDNAAFFIEFAVAPAAADGSRAVNVSGRMGYLDNVGGKPVCFGDTGCPSNTTFLLQGEDELRVRLLVDRPIVEVFVNEGRFAWSVDADYWPSEARVPRQIAQYNAQNSSIHFYHHGAVGMPALQIRNVSLWGMACGWGV